MIRRTFLFGLAASVAAAPFAVLSSGAVAQDGPRFSRIVVDARPLIARGGGAAAAILRPQLQESLQREFAGRIGRGGPVLVVRLETVLLAQYAGDGFGRRGHTPSDYLTGEVIAGDKRFPLFVTQSPGVGGAWYLPQSEVRRLRALADQYAGWVRRKV